MLPDLSIGPNNRLGSTLNQFITPLIISLQREILYHCVFSLHNIYWTVIVTTLPIKIFYYMIHDQPIKYKAGL